MGNVNKQSKKKKTNPWEWNGTNPYKLHPLGVLGMEDKPSVTAAMIKTAVHQMESRIKLKTSEENSVDNMLLVKIQELLLDPYTRVFCELMRVPPVEIPKDDLNGIKKTAAKQFKSLDPFPEPEKIDCNWGVLAEEIVSLLKADNIKTADIEMPTLSDSEKMDLKSKTIVTFQRRQTT